MAFRKPGVRVVGLKQFTKELKKFGDVAVQDIKDAHEAAAKIVYDAAKPKAPVHGSSSVISGKPYWQTPGHAAGNMARTLRHSGTQRGGFVRAGKKLVPYAGPVHFGWPSRPNPARGWQGGPIRPNPFIFNALDERREQVAVEFQRYIDRLITKYVP